jgi:hypothetical protein
LEWFQPRGLVVEVFEIVAGDAVAGFRHRQKLQAQDLPRSGAGSLGRVISDNMYEDCERAILWANTTS